MMKMRKRIIKYTGVVFHIKKFISMILIFIICFTFNSCYLKNERKVAEVIIKYEIPFVDIDSRWNNVELIETDEYGRKLYCLSATGDSFNNVLSDYIVDDSANSPVFAYFICQKYNDTNVYCYKGVSYILVPNLNISDEELNDFKNENDWNNILNETKMTPLSINLGNASDYSLTYKEKAVATLQKQLGKDFQGYYIDDLYAYNTNLCFIVREVQTWINNNDGETNNFGKNYIFTYNETSDEVCYEELGDDIKSWREQICLFKEKIEDGTMSSDSDS